jgi:hypothetical protein
MSEMVHHGAEQKKNTQNAAKWRSSARDERKQQKQLECVVAVRLDTLVVLSVCSIFVMESY